MNITRKVGFIMPAKFNYEWPYNFIIELLEFDEVYRNSPNDIIPTIEYVLSTLRDHCESSERAIIYHYRNKLSYKDIAYIMSYGVQKSESDIQKMVHDGQDFIKNSPFLIDCLRHGIHDLILQSHE